eukprot:TRINITY_DN817_c0_g1_i1.p1 TRINITY_DN817_c0_g1~~TRINITY_DN817_c0_g1_i1.p1  ORF type:complete len:154 (-),score=25.25 TRINITY_DN817_c0_g1_i1:8-469(-)
MTGVAWNREVTADIKELQKKYGVTVLVSLMEKWEFENLKVTSIPTVCSELGIEHVQFDWKDGGCPEISEAFKQLVFSIYKKILAGDKVIVHCMGGLGRSGTFAMCLVQLLMPEISPKESFSLVRKYRKDSCDAEEQQQFVFQTFPKLLLEWQK